MGQSRHQNVNKIQCDSSIMNILKTTITICKVKEKMELSQRCLYIKSMLKRTKTFHNQSSAAI